MKKIFFFLTSFIALDVQAHPVSFQDSMGIMGYHNPKMSHLQLNYSWKYWLATGLHHFSIRPRSQDKVKNANFFSTNLVLKRWNGSNYQANLYTILGAGRSDISGSTQDAGLGVFQFDIEDRKYYFLTKYAHIQNPDDAELKQTTVRIGLAPYVGGFDDIHSWFILEWQKNNIINSKVDEDVTSYLRFFYENVLFEIGYSFDGNAKFNYITHF
ncbi:MAG: hypothetical protein OXB84_04900 [Halobacteriovoraceae bacterium]|nr:hypothetical protein [Halobacteriovoraceae bacterium]